MLSNPDGCLLAAVRVGGVENATLEGNSLVITSCAEDRLKILRAIEAAGGKIETFVTEELSIEDIYMRYVIEESLQNK